MKRNIVRIPVVALLLALCACLCACGPRPVAIGEIEQFRLYHLSGKEDVADELYALTAQQGIYTVTLQEPTYPLGTVTIIGDPEDYEAILERLQPKEGEPKYQELSYPTGADFARRLEGLLRQAQVERWNGFDQCEPGAEAGPGFDLYIRMKDGTELHARGRMYWPSGYNALVEEIDELFWRPIRG